MKRFLLEVGTEEIPSRMVPDALESLEDRWSRWLIERDVDPDFPDSDTELEVMGTPRRLVVDARLPEHQDDRREVLRGPPVEVAYEDGEPTEALRGFCRQHDADPGEVDRETMDGGNYVVLQRHRSGDPVEELLAEEAGTVVMDLPWPKSMRWEASGARFIRPIRWVLALWGDEPLDLRVGPVESGGTTRGRRFTGQEQRTVEDPEDYFRVLEEGGVEPRPARRAEQIREGARRLASEVEGRPLRLEELLGPLTHLVEQPTVFRGSFDPDFLSIPDAVLEETMVSHQKYLPVAGEDSGELEPFFIGVRNGGPDGLDTVREGNERVLRARLNDAEFFWEKDLESDFEAWREELDGVVYQSELGSLRDKTERVAGLLDGRGAGESLVKIARHAKNDLVSEMVGEFPDLQGTMGKLYARESGWSEEDARVIEDYYRPADRSDRLPGTPGGRRLGVMDRMDTLVGFFAVGHEPSGDSDPYGLRRDALGVLRILLEGDPAWDVEALIDETVSLFRGRDRSVPEGSMETLEGFFRDRLYHWLERETDAPDRFLRAVLPGFWSRPPEALRRVRWLMRWRDEPAFERLVTAAQRVSNIAPDEVTEAPDPDRFEREASRALWEVYGERHGALEAALEDGDADRLLERLSDLKDPIDRFFDDVMVMAEDEDKRLNRLKLVSQFRDLFARVADFTVL